MVQQRNDYVPRTASITQGSTRTQRNKHESTWMSSHWKLNFKKVNSQHLSMPDTEKLKDKVAIVTGAAQGLGKEIKWVQSAERILSY